jgi:hypothetical protein
MHGRTRLGGAMLALSVLAGCDNEMCDKGALPQPFAALHGDLPKDARVCAAKRRDWSSNKGDGLLPNSVTLDFRQPNATAAWLATVEHLEARGWKRFHQRIDPDPKAMQWVIFKKGGSVLDFTFSHVERGAWPLRNAEVSAQLNLTKEPCDGGPERRTVCSGGRRVHCLDRYPYASEVHPSCK